MPEFCVKIEKKHENRNFLKNVFQANNVFDLQRLQNAKLRLLTKTFKNFDKFRTVLIPWSLSYLKK